MEYEILNSLNSNEYKWVFNLNSIERPSNRLLEEKFRNESQTVKSDLKELINLWDFYFKDSESEKLKDSIEEWVETACLLKEVLFQIDAVFVKAPKDSLVESMKSLPYLGHIPGRHTQFLEQNCNLDDDLTFPELQPYLGREILFAKADYEEILQKATIMIEKYGKCYFKWLKYGKIYPVLPCENIEDVKKYLELDPYMLYMQEDNVLSVQQGLNLKWETRFFVIAGKRAGQSLVRPKLTPLHKDFEIPKEFLQVYPEMFTFAREVMQALRDGSSLFSQTYVLDIAWDEDKGKPIVLELNPIHNSGLYATQTSLLVSLAKENPDEFLLRV